MISQNRLLERSISVIYKHRSRRPGEFLSEDKHTLLEVVISIHFFKINVDLAEIKIVSTDGLCGTNRKGSTFSKRKGFKKL